MTDLPRPLILEWVAQQTQSQALVDRITGPEFLILHSGITPFPTGAVRYYFIVQPLTSVNREEIESEAQRLRCLPLTFSFNMVNVSRVQQRQYAEGLEDILMADLSCRYHLDVMEMQHIYLDQPATLILKPISRDGLPFYLTDEERKAFLADDYQQLVGYDLLSPDPLIWFYFNREKTDASKWYLTSWHKMAVFPIIPPPEQDPTSEVAQLRDIFTEAEDVEDMSTPFGTWWTDRDIFRNEVNLFVSSLRIDNYFTIDLEDDVLARELGEMWSIDYYGTFSLPAGLDANPNKKIHVFASNKSLGLDAPTWFQDALLRIRLGYLPLFYLGGDWVQYVEPLMENMARLQYAATRAYLQMAQTSNLVLEEYVWEVKCLPNLLISAPFSALSEVTAFENLFRAFLIETRNWQVIECPDLETCARRRLAIEKENPSLHPLGISIPADPETVYLVIDTSPGASTISPEIETINPQEVNGLSVAAQRGIPISRRHQVKLDGDITFRYIPSHKATYSFYYNEEHQLFIAETEDPVEILTRMKKVKEDLLSPWGESYYKYHPETKLRREHFLPSRLLKKRYV